MPADSTTASGLYKGLSRLTLLCAAVTCGLSGSETCLYLLIHKGHASMDVQNKMGMTPAHLGQ